jgi:hypothetical protein
MQRPNFQYLFDSAYRQGFFAVASRNARALARKNPWKDLEPLTGMRNIGPACAGVKENRKSTKNIVGTGLF